MPLSDRRTRFRRDRVAVQVEVDEGQRQGERQRVVPALPQVEEQGDVPQSEDSGEGHQGPRRFAEHPPGPEEEAGQAGKDEGEPGGERVAPEEPRNGAA
jgi:hypothetical protein